MATFARAVQAVKPHIPLIRFPNRAAGEAVSMVENTSSKSAAVPSASSSKPPIGKTPRGSGVDSVPPQYKRKLLSIEEMEFIERGGPA